MGNILGDIFFGGQSRTDRKQITDLYKTLGPAAATAIPEGITSEEDALKYFRGLRSGNRQLQAEAAAPAVNAISAQNEAEKQRLASEGTGRGGGVNAAQQQTQDAATKASVDVLTNLAPQAAREEASVGGAVTGQGLQAASEQGNLSEAERRTNLAHQGAEGGDIGKVASAAIGALTPQAPAFPTLTPGQISGAYGGPTEAPVDTTGIPSINDIDWLQALQPVDEGTAA